MSWMQCLSVCFMTEELYSKEAERPDSWRSGIEANSRFFTSRYLLCFHLAQHCGWGRERRNKMGRRGEGKEIGEKGEGKGRNKSSASTWALSTSPAHHWHPWATRPCMWNRFTPTFAVVGQFWAEVSHFLTHPTTSIYQLLPLKIQLQFCLFFSCFVI